MSKKNKRRNIQYVILGIGGGFLLLTALISIGYGIIYTLRVKNTPPVVIYDEVVDEPAEDEAVVDSEDSETADDQSGDEEEKDDEQNVENDLMEESLGSIQSDFNYVWYKDEYFKFQYPNVWEVEVDRGEIDYFPDQEPLVAIKSINLGGKNYSFSVSSPLGHGVASWSFNNENPERLWLCGDTCGPEFLKLTEKPDIKKLKFSTGYELPYLALDLSKVEYRQFGEPGSENIKREEYTYPVGENGQQLTYLIAFESAKKESEIHDNDFTNTLFLGQEDLTNEIFMYGFEDYYEKAMVDFAYSNYFYSEEDAEQYIDVIKTFFDSIERIDK